MISTDCSVPQVLPIGGSYTCSFVATVINNSGETVLDFVTATAVDDEGNIAEDTDSASVLITDEPPVFTVTKSAIPTSVPEPGGAVFFTVMIDNTGQEQVTITGLVDNPGAINLDGLGGCSVPQTIPPGGRYTCSFPGTVSGNGGETVIDTVTATGRGRRQQHARR